jgi:acetolactate synthase-1/2/3 large subunit
MEHPETTGAEAIVAALEDAGVEVVFGICGHANVSMLDALRASSIDFVYVRHEQNAAHAADAYYRLSHRPGVVLTTIGPGLANAVTGVWEAAMAGSGVVVISGNVQSYVTGRGAFQELALHEDGAQAEIYRPFAKRVWRVPAPELIPFVMHRAINLATVGRPGPVLVDLPVDYFSAVRSFEPPNVASRRPTSMRVRGDAGEIRRGVELLASARRPLIHAGNGVGLSEAEPQLAALAEQLAVPVTTSMTAHGVLDTAHPFYGGIPGAIGTPTANALAREADVVLALGTGFCEMETSTWDPEYSFRFGAGASLVQVDLDPNEVGRAYPVEVGIVGDIGAVLDEMLEVARELVAPGVRAGSDHVGELRRLRAAQDREQEAASAEAGEPLSMEHAVSLLKDVLPDDLVVVCDVGAFRHAVYSQLRMRPRSWYFPSGLVTMGAGPGAALGAKLACPDRPVLCFVGDGGFTANGQALATAVEAGIPVVYAVVNNFANDAIRAYQRNHFDGRLYGTEFTTPDGDPWNPDFVAMAGSFGVEAVRVERSDEVVPAFSRALASARPYVIELVTGPARPRPTGHWDVNAVIAAEGAFKRTRVLA